MKTIIIEVAEDGEIRIDAVGFKVRPARKQPKQSSVRLVKPRAAGASRSSPR